MTWKHIYSSVCPRVTQQELPSVAPRGELFDYTLLILGTFFVLFSFPTSTSWDHLLSKLFAIRSLPQDLLLGESKLSQPSYSSLSFEGEPFEMYKLLISFLICCHIFCLILCHFLSVLPIYNLSKQT